MRFPWWGRPRPAADGAHPTEDGLIFAPEPRASGTLAAMAGLSLLGHAVSFYLVQVFYVPAAALSPSPPPVRWTVLPAGSPENAALQRWLDVVDPALAVGGPEPAAAQVLAGLPPASYVPSYEAGSSAGRGLPPVRLENPIPGSPGVTSGADPLTAWALPPGPVPDAVRGQRPAGSRSADAPGVVTFPENLRARLSPGTRAPTPPRLAHPAAALAELLRPATFLVGVGPEGGVPLVFREESTGAPAADDAARDTLRALRFTPAAGGVLTWGRVTFHWGRETYR